ncbi:hypothetical protein LRP50_09160 [Enterovibrio sp. ZSDZ42]|uniref:Uncharacterized protein n=1 Tax=Enterovibrio gelatinilyticus TaxID=2899819 RepID=A0ABT5QZ66_9GAMM|nr:hypothetical protein [Enterovibrio sp. ZSDZ42]MDD1793294.1 hypothetical protein [Enterovibrio sp. ZSDZ42]
MELREKVTSETENVAVLNKPLSFVIVMVGVAFAVFNLQLVFADEHVSALKALLFGVMAFIAIFVVLFWAFDSKNTVVNDAFISKGKTKIHWTDVTDSKSNDFSIVITAGEKKVVVNYYAYSNPEDLMATIKKNVKRSL